MPLATINGTILHYRVVGEGIPILFIHPPLLTSMNFRYQQAQLSDEFQVISFDVRGHGQSGRSLAPLTYGLIVEDMKQLLDHLGLQQAYLCGYSTGGSIALEAMLTHPKRFIGAILVSAMSEASGFLLKNRIRAAVQLSRWRLSFRLLQLAITIGNSDRLLTFRNLLRDSKRGDRKNIHQYYKFSLKYNCTAQLRKIKAPVLLLYGEKDTNFRQYRDKLAQGLPGCEIKVFKQEKHQLPSKAADEMNETIRVWMHTVTGHENANSGTEAVIPEAFIIGGEDQEGRDLQI